ncbi:MAG: hypothetical protein JO021_00345, partial [Alphaproteobacteria bacterium]|nr:hypothetical protein [Alphaproteobacteria bacterium]
MMSRRHPDVARAARAAALALPIALMGLPADAADPEGTPRETNLLGQVSAWRDDLEADGWLLHGQYTTIAQGHPRFRSPYVGDNSLT